MVRMVAGRLFRMSGLATEKARLPNCVLLRLTAAARVVEKRSWRTFESVDKVKEVRRTSTVESLMHDSSNFEGDTVLDRQPV